MTDITDHQRNIRKEVGHACIDFGHCPISLFFLVVALLWIANTLESRTIRRNRILIPTESLALLSIAEAFEPIYSVLWEAPIAALDLVDCAGTSGIPVERLRPIYSQAAARFPEIYEGCGFVEWLQFLEETELISLAGYKISLTPEGKAFLSTDLSPTHWWTRENRCGTVKIKRAAILKNQAVLNAFANRCWLSPRVTAHTAP